VGGFNDEIKEVEANVMGVKKPSELSGCLGEGGS
jgi:hypothetical protein